MKPFSKYFLKLTYISMVLITLGLSACSNSTNSTAESKQTINNQQQLELGTVVSTRKVQIQAESIDSYGNFGVAASSGGFRGIYGSIDLATIGRIFRNTTGTKTAQEIIVKKASGETVAITQKFEEAFKQGDSVKIIIRNGIARVFH